MPRDARAMLRPVGVLALLVVVAVGVSAARHAPPTHGVGVHGAGAVVVTFGIVVLAVAATMMLAALRAIVRTARRRRRGDDEIQIIPERHDTVWQRLGALVIVAIAVGLAAGIALAAGHVHFTSAPGRPGTGRPVPSTPAPSTPHSSEHGTTSGAVIALAVVAAVVVVALGGYLAVRALRRRESVEPIESAAEHRTSEVLRRASAALARPTDPRAAILACYRVMEQRLSAAGADRRVADTPDELLARAGRSGLLLPDAARRLATLFREARFSTHPMTEAHRAQAEQALGSVVHVVERRP